MFSRITFPVYLLVLSLLTFYLSRFPGHNGDMPFYIACVVEKEQSSMDGVISRTQEILRQELPKQEYEEHNRRFLESDPEILERYRIKPFYILLVLAVHKIGVSYVWSTVIPSLICYFLIGLSIWRITSSRLDPVKSFLVSLACMVILPTLILARLSTPDAISCFVLLNALFLIYEERRKLVWLSLFILAIVIRLDNLVSELILLFALWQWPVKDFKNKLNFKTFTVLAFILTGVACLVNGRSAHHFFWFTDPHFSLAPGQYIKDLTLYFLVIPGSFFMYMVVLFMITGFRRGFSWKQEVNWLFYTVCLIVFIRFLLYPYYEERYLTPFLLFSLLTIAFQVDKGGNSTFKSARIGSEF